MYLGCIEGNGNDVMPANGGRYLWSAFGRSFPKADVQWVSEGALARMRASNSSHPIFALYPLSRASDRPVDMATHPHAKRKPW
eukprot:1184233-Prorocentrum_minimum.AAC.3